MKLLEPGDKAPDFETITGGIYQVNNASASANVLWPLTEIRSYGSTSGQQGAKSSAVQNDIPAVAPVAVRPFRYRYPNGTQGMVTGGAGALLRVESVKAADRGRRSARAAAPRHESANQAGKVPPGRRRPLLRLEQPKEL